MKLSRGIRNASKKKNQYIQQDFKKRSRIVQKKVDQAEEMHKQTWES